MKRLYASLLTLFFVLVGAGAWAQSLTGVIRDENQQPLPGAVVQIESQNKSAVTDMNGSYTLTGLSAGNVTVNIQALGYKTTQKTVDLSAGKAARLDVQLEVELSELDEVVVVGYGVQRKRDVTGSVVKLKTKELTDMPTPSFETAIQGKAPGVQIVTGSGMAGSGSVVRVRGIASISAGGDPLYVVDGIPITQDYFLKGNGGAMNNNPLATLNPNDIESVEILKDAAAVGIYGSRGANGVIIITTKRGRSAKKKLTFDFTANLGFATPTAKPNIVSGPQYLQLYEEAWVNDGNIGTPTLPGNVISWADAQNVNTDWWDAMTRVGVKQGYDLSVGQNLDKFNYRVGLSYNDNQSYVINNSYNRMSARFNGDYRFSDKFNMSFSTSLTQGINNRVDAAWSGGIGATMSTALPIFPIYNDDGSYFGTNFYSQNPVAVANMKKWRNRELRSINNLTLNYSPVKNLSLSGSVSYDFMDIQEDVFEPEELRREPGRIGFGSQNITKVNNVNAFLTASYLWNPSEKHDWNFMVGTEVQSRINKYGVWADSSGNTGEFSGISKPLYQDESPLNSRSLNYSINPGSGSNFLSYFTRINYTYDKKYMAQLVARADASSNFGPENRWGFFPSLGGGWIISEEDFLKGNKVLNYLKLRASVGISGNANLPPNQWRGQWQQNGSYNGQPITYQSYRENPTLKWETNTIYDAALEFGIFGDRLTGELGWYYKDSRDVILDVSLPRYNGFTNYYDNLASIHNTGVEFSVKYKAIAGEDFRWDIDFNVAYNYNEITSIGGYTEDAVSGGTNDTRVVVGKPVGTNYLVRFARVDSQTGLPVYLDAQGNETMIWDPNDRVAVGKVLPDAVGGITNTFKYKNWDLSFLFVYSIGGNIYDSSSKRQLGVITDWTLRTDLFDRWQQPGDVATYPRLTLDTETYGSNTPWINTDMWLHDASYMRLRNLTIGYTIPKAWAEKVHLTGARISFTATNILTFTTYPGLDPEVARDFENATDRNMSVNISYLTPPQEKTYNINLNIQF